MKDKERADLEEVFEKMLTKYIPGLVRHVVQEEFGSFHDKFETQLKNITEDINKTKSSLNEVSNKLIEDVRGFLQNEIKTELSKSADALSDVINNLGTLSTTFTEKMDNFNESITSNFNKFNKSIEKDITNGISKNRDAMLELANKIFELKDKTLESLQEVETQKESAKELSKLVSPYRDTIERLHTLNQLIVNGVGSLTIDTLRSQLETVRDKIQMDKGAAPFQTTVLRKFREMVNELNREREPLGADVLMIYKNKIDSLISEIKKDET